jgi:hypothetical protein
MYLETINLKQPRILVNKIFQHKICVKNTATKHILINEYK